MQLCKAYSLTLLVHAEGAWVWDSFLCPAATLRTYVAKVHFHFSTRCIGSALHTLQSPVNNAFSTAKSQNPRCNVLYSCIPDWFVLHSTFNIRAHLSYLRLSVEGSCSRKLVSLVSMHAYCQLYKHLQECIHPTDPCITIWEHFCSVCCHHEKTVIHNHISGRKDWGYWSIWGYWSNGTHVLAKPLFEESLLCIKHLLAMLKVPALIDTHRDSSLLSAMVTTCLFVDLWKLEASWRI